MKSSMSSLLILVNLLLLASVQAGLYNAKKDDVIVTDHERFDKEVSKTNEVHLVEFYSPGCTHCVGLTEAYKTLATALKGVIKVAAVDVDDNRALGELYAYTGIPAIFLFNLEKKPIEYNGQRTAKAIVEFVLKHITRVSMKRLGIGIPDPDEQNAGNVVELADGDFDTEINSDPQKLTIVMFYAPWCGHCKTLKPEWSKTATLLKGKVRVAAIDATIHGGVSSRFQIKGFPTVKLFYPGKLNDPVDYEGARMAKAIADWAESHMQDLIPAKKLTELLGQGEFEDACMDQICLVSFMPDLDECNAECRREYIGMLEKASDDYKKQRWGWLWTQGMNFQELEKAVGVGGFGYPAMVAVNLKKNMYSISKKSFSDEGIKHFCQTLAFGGGSSVPLRAKLTELNARADPWDGEDLPTAENVREEL